jgi:hypothetical protein
MSYLDISVNKWKKLDTNSLPRKVLTILWKKDHYKTLNYIQLSFIQSSLVLKIIKSPLSFGIK